MDSDKHEDRLIPVTHWHRYHEWPPMGGLRHLISHAAENGFAKCIVRVGTRILIDEHAFFVWCRNNKVKEERQ